MNENIEKLLNQYGSLLSDGIAVAEKDVVLFIESGDDFGLAHSEGMLGAYCVALAIFEQLFADFGQVEFDGGE